MYTALLLLIAVTTVLANNMPTCHGPGSPCASNVSCGCLQQCCRNAGCQTTQCSVSNGAIRYSCGQCPARGSQPAPAPAPAAPSGPKGCYLAGRADKKGTCTKKDVCNESGDVWMKSTVWGRKRAYGCENEAWNVRCCIKARTSNPQPQPNPQPAPAPEQPPQPLPPASSDLTTLEQAYLDFHNQERQCYGVPLMTWNKQLALDAKSYAFKCHWGHDTALLGRLNQGENLAAGSGTSQPELSLVNGWLAEQQHYDCARNSCRKQPCGHYTQMIWADSTEVGCASVVCNKGSPFSGFGNTWKNIVCRYKKRGNTIGVHPTGASRCGNCARSLEAEDLQWADADDYELCVPSNTGENSDETEPTCECPVDTNLDVDGTCIPPVFKACTNEPLTCKDGTILFPRPPACQVSCAEIDAAVDKGAEESAAAQQAVAYAALAAAGQAMVL